MPRTRGGAELQVSELAILPANSKTVEGGDPYNWEDCVLGERPAGMTVSLHQEGLWWNPQAINRWYVRHTIDELTNTNPAVVTISSRTYNAGQTVWIDDCLGPKQVNNDAYTVANPVGNSFELEGFDASGLNSYVSGSGWAVIEPQSLDTLENDKQDEMRYWADQLRRWTDPTIDLEAIAAARGETPEETARIVAQWQATHAIVDEHGRDVYWSSQELTKYAVVMSDTNERQMENALNPLMKRNQEWYLNPIQMWPRRRVIDLGDLYSHVPDTVAAWRDPNTLVAVDRSLQTRHGRFVIKDDATRLPQY